MKIEQLRQLLEIQKTGSFNQAAANLFTTQPNLSLSMRNLEDELGYPLFVRSNKGVTMTALGERFAKYAYTTLFQFDQLSTLKKNGKSSNAISLSVSYNRSRYVVEMIAKMYEKHRLTGEQIRMELYDGDRDDVINRVYKGDSEIGFIGLWQHNKKATMTQIQSKGLEFHCLGILPVTVSVGKANPLYSLPEGTLLKPEMLKPYTHVFYEELDCKFYSGITKDLGILDYAGEVIVNDRSALHEILDTIPSFAITGTNRKAYKTSNYYPTTRCFDIEGSPIMFESGWIKSRDYVPSSLVNELIGLIKQCH